MHGLVRRQPGPVVGATNYRLTPRNGVLVYRKVAADAASAGATLTVDTTVRLLQLAMGDFTSPGLGVTGDAGVLQQLADSRITR